MKLYKGKYTIGVYAPVEEGETLIALCDTVKEFAEFMEITIYNASTILKDLFEGKHHFIRFNNMCCGVEFINMEEE